MPRKEIIKLLIKHDRMFSAYVQALRDCTSWEDGNVLARILPAVEKATERQIDELVAACNGKVRDSFAISGARPSQYGSGLIPHLHRLGSRKFARSRDNTIAPAVQAKKRVKVEDEIPF